MLAGTAEEARAMLERAAAAVQADESKALEMFMPRIAASETAIFTCSVPTQQTAWRRRVQRTGAASCRTSRMPMVSPLARKS
jgi:hypothetical protein